VTTGVSMPSTSVTFVAGMDHIRAKSRMRFWRDYALSNLPVVFTAVVGWFLLDGWWFVLVVLLAAALSELIFVALSERYSREDALSGAEAMVGSTVTVSRAFGISPGAAYCHGRVLYAGEDWAARARGADAELLTPGARATIRAVEGLELVVEIIEEERRMKDEG
jgi:membrane protein implicated in regulation of membrane protease activity